MIILPKRPVREYISTALLIIVFTAGILILFTGTEDTADSRITGMSVASATGAPDCNAKGENYYYDRTSKSCKKCSLSTVCEDYEQFECKEDYQDPCRIGCYYDTSCKSVIDKFYIIKPNFLIKGDYDITEYDTIIAKAKALVQKCNNNKDVKSCVENELRYYTDKNLEWKIEESDDAENYFYDIKEFTEGCINSLDSGCVCTFEKDPKYEMNINIIQQQNILGMESEEPAESEYFPITFQPIMPLDKPEKIFVNTGLIFGVGKGFTVQFNTSSGLRFLTSDSLAIYKSVDFINPSNNGKWEFVKVEKNYVKTVSGAKMRAWDWDIARTLSPDALSCLLNEDKYPSTSSSGGSCEKCSDCENIKDQRICDLDPCALHCSWDTGTGKCIINPSKPLIKECYYPRNNFIINVTSRQYVNLFEKTIMVERPVTYRFAVRLEEKKNLPGAVSVISKPKGEKSFFIIFEKTPGVNDYDIYASKNPIISLNPADKKATISLSSATQAWGLDYNNPEWEPTTNKSVNQLMFRYNSGKMPLYAGLYQISPTGFLYYYTDLTMTTGETYYFAVVPSGSSLQPLYTASAKLDDEAQPGPVYISGLTRSPSGTTITIDWIRPDKNREGLNVPYDPNEEWSYDIYCYNGNKPVSLALMDNIKSNIISKSR